MHAHLEALAGRAEEARAWTATRRANGDDGVDDDEATAPDVFSKTKRGEYRRESELLGV